MAYDGSIKIDTKIDTGGFSVGIEKLKRIAKTGCAAVGTSLATITAGITTAATASAKVGSAFEAAMSKVSAISGATGKDLEVLTDKAKEMGAKTKFSASESAEALQYMAMAGWQTQDMLGGIDGIMNLAAADGLDLATTSDIVTDAITAFGLKASDSSHFADVLAKASSSANTNVSMLGESFKYVAPLAGTMGYSVEDVSLALGLMANASVKGSMAGTSLKTALSNLASPTDQIAEVMNKYGISISDTQGNALPLIDVLKQLREKFGGLSETEQTAAASTLFGKEAMSGMLAIINASDSDFKNLTENINNADGAAQSMADTMQDNLQGQITILKSALEGLGIEIYEGMQEPLKEAAVEAQGYVNRLTDAFKSGGLTGMIEEAGNIFGELAVKAAEAAPKMVNAAVGFLKAFVNGIYNNSGKLVSAAKQIVKTIVDNLVSLLPVSVQKPVKECVNTISKSFNNGGLKEAIKTVSNILKNLGKVAANIAKNVLPPLAKAIDFVGKNTKILVPLVTAMFAAYKSYTIISSLTAIMKANAAAVTAESLATAASTGTITLKQIAVGALTGQIGLATAAQYAWNLAMSLNPIGLVVAAVAALAAGIAILTLSQENENTAAEMAAETNDKLKDKYDAVTDAASKFYDGISSAGSCLDGFNDSIIVSNEKQQELSSKMDEVQREITEIAKTATEERRTLTDTEIQRLDELFEKQKELADQQLKIQQEYQGVVKDMANDLVENHNLSLEEYASYAQQYINTAEETRDQTVKAAEEQKTNWLAEKRALIGTDDQYTQEWYDKQREQANKDYDKAVEEANTLCADTLNIIQQGYADRADAMSNYANDYETQEQKINNIKEVSNMKVEQLEKERSEKLAEYTGDSYEQMQQRAFINNEYDKKIEDETERSNKEIEKLRSDFSKNFDKDVENQVGTWIAMLLDTELYGGKISDKNQDMVNKILKELERLPDESKETMSNTMNGMLSKVEEKEPSLFAKAAEIAGGFINTIKKKFQVASPSKVMKKIFGYVIEGGEVGLENEAPNLYKTADKVGDTFTEKLKSKLNTDGLIGKMRAAVFAETAKVSTNLTAKVVHDVNVSNDDKDKKVVLKGDVITHMDVNGREFAVATTPYISEELAWQR